MDPREPAPWPILLGLAAFTAAFVTGAIHSTYPTGATILWLMAVPSAYLTAHLTAASILYRIIRHRTEPATTTLHDILEPPIDTHTH